MGNKSSNGIDSVLVVAKNKIVKTLKDLSEESSHYVIGGVLVLGLSAVSYLFPNLISKDLFYVPLTFFVCGFLVFIYKSTAKVRGSTVARLLMSVIAVVLSTLSYAVAKQALNYGFEVPASAFPITHSVISLLAIPAVAVIGVSGIGFIAILALPFFFIPIDFSRVSAKSFLEFKIPLKPFEDKIFWKAIFRYFALIIMVSVCFTMVEQINWYSERVDGYAKRFAYHFEAEQFSYCALNEGEKVTYLNGDLIVVASYEKTESNYSFRVSTCVSILK